MGFNSGFKGLKTIKLRIAKELYLFKTLIRKWQPFCRFTVKESWYRAVYLSSFLPINSNIDRLLWDVISLNLIAPATKVPVIWRYIYLAVFKYFVHESRSFVFTHICKVGTRISPVRIVFEVENYFGKLWVFIGEWLKGNLILVFW